MVIKSRYQIDIPNSDLLSYIFDGKHEDKQRPLFIDALKPEERVTKDELEKLVKQFACGLRVKAGLESGDVVLSCTANSIWCPMAMLGTIGAGGIYTGTSPGYTPIELKHQIKISEAKILLSDAERLPLVLGVAKDLGIPQSKVFLLSKDQAAADRYGVLCLNQLFNVGEWQWDRFNDLERAKRTAVLNFSSGTTGLPKACEVSEHNLIANSSQFEYLTEQARIRKNDPTYCKNSRYVCYIPLYHAMGLFSFCVLYIKENATTFILPGFSLEAVLSVIQTHRITNLTLVPPVAVLLIKSPIVKNYDLSSVLYIFCGAAPLGKETSLQLEHVFSKSGAHSRQGYGMSEATCAITLFAPDEWDDTHEGVGYLIPNMQAKIVDLEGKEVGVGEVGELLIKGPNVIKGYWKNPEATKGTIDAEGWLSTGDFVRMDENGLFSVIDRKKELIKVKGFQVAPSELEAHLLDCEHVVDCAVIRVERSGQEHPQAHVVPAGEHVTENHIRDFMDPRLSAHKRLTGGVVFTEAIPKSPSGKILRRLIKDPHAEAKARL